jgi:hypothetical protein
MADDTGLPPGFVKAYIEIDGGGKLDCYFNPTEYSIAKANTWEPIKVNGKPSPDQKFTSGTPRKLELSLLFDQTFPPYKMSVGDATSMLLDAMEVPQGTDAGTPTAAPPFITFGWGKTVFKGACTSLTCAYKLFSPDGEPLRADVKISLVQTGAPTPGQNPTTRATSGFGQHTVKDGDTLPSISYGAYGDATKWRLIAEANGVDNPLHLRRGRRLALPSLEG